MRAKAESSPRPIGIDLPVPSVVAREGLRALAAFGLYLVLYPAWILVGAHELYQAIVLKLATVLVLATQHFPVVSTLENLSIVHLDYLPILALGYFLVSTRMPWGIRIKRYGALLLAILVLQVVGVIFETGVDSAQNLLEKKGLVVLLPWQFRVVDGFKYLLIDFGLNIGPFVVMLLGMAWNTGLGISRGQAPRWAGRRLLGVSGAVVLGLAVGALSWGALRESDPRHVMTHARLGHLFLRSGQPAKAEEQYRIALRHGSDDGEACLSLARLQADQGRTGEALRSLESGLATVQDPAWRDLIRKEEARLASSR